MVSTIDSNVKKVDILHKENIKDLSNSMSVPITDKKLKIDKNGNIDYASFNKITFNLKSEKAHHAGAYLVSKEEKQP